MSKRRPIHSPSSTPSTPTKNNSFARLRASMQENRGGTRPIAPPSSVSLVLVTMIVHVCKKSLLYDTRLKAAIYFIAICLGSILADVMPIPKTYFSRSNNILNRFFIKWAWGWLLTTAGPWVILTAYTIGCGRRSVIIKHIARLIFATLVWMFWMNVFHYIEYYYGRCVNVKDRSLQVRSKCLQAGHFWNGIDISGHAFIIIYSSLILSEEGRSLLGWEGIKDFIMNEEYNRKTSTEASKGYLRNLSDKDLDFLKKAHRDLTPYLRGLFIAMTLQQIIWDVMLVATIMYYHTVPEKFVGGAIAILMWYASYNWLFRIPQLGMTMPGEGIFKYNEEKDKQQGSTPKLKRSTSNKVPTFMGMPIRVEKEEPEKNGSKLKTLEGDMIYKRNI